MGLTPKKVLAVTMKYADGLALNGVAIKQPQIDPVTGTWKIFDPVSDTYIDTGAAATGFSPRISTMQTWETYNNITRLWVDTGIQARWLEFNARTAFPVPGNAERLYIATDEDVIYRWNGADYVKIGGGGRTYTHTQSMAATVWTIPHNLNKQFVSVQLIDYVGNTCTADIVYTGANVVTVTFAVPMTGTAIIRQ